MVDDDNLGWMFIDLKSNENGSSSRQEKTLTNQPTTLHLFSKETTPTNQPTK